MRVPTQLGRARMHFNITPMIDVVFLLLIFFLVTSHLARQEVQAELDLPTAESGNEPTATTAPRVTINILPEGDRYRLMLGGEAVEREELLRRIRHERDRLGENLEVRIRTDQQVPYEQIEPILLACARSGIWNITFAVLEDRTGGS